MVQSRPVFRSRACWGYVQSKLELFVGAWAVHNLSKRNRVYAILGGKVWRCVPQRLRVVRK